ncbi:MAG: hypothetical protein CVU13_11505 [Bacteroidetes bacterium HGW-Bacteroidetes-8]|jgi:hypothetical protein|nr:MAG: hypothetical protein CVU13_11505 [Bacteroidetes bacterium HGW-Bacteroidetes-8]
MKNNFYWNVYKNLEKELVEMLNLIHIDDKQLEIYSIKIAELILRTAVEIESISKTLYFQNGGTKSDDINLFFDTDCIELLESKWVLSKKIVQVSAPNVDFRLPENMILTPLKKANKRGSSSSDWQKAYQAIKHNRETSLPKANLKHLVRALAALFVLNLYYRDNSYWLDKDSSGTKFDSSLGSSLFSIKLHVRDGISADIVYSKNADFDECIYILKPTDDTRTAVQQELKVLNEKTAERTKTNIIDQLSKQLKGIQISHEEMPSTIRALAEKIKIENMQHVARENGLVLKKVFENLKYEAILNKNEY